MSWKNLALFEELPTGLLEVPELFEESFRRIVTGNYTIEEARKVFDPYFYDFLEANLNYLEHTEILRRKALQSDIDKFMTIKPPISAEDIKKLLSLEFHCYIEHFLLKKRRKPSPTPALGP